MDGSGNPAFYADIGIRGDTIAAIGTLAGATAMQRIDAAGLIVAPGFIDIHSHGRRGIFEVPTAENYLREGVTTMVEGPDGSSPLPLAPFFERIASTRVSINVASFVGQGTIRSQVMGLVDRKATPEELDKMKALATQAMKDGAFGMSTGLFYVPGNFTPTEEVIELAKIVGRMGGMHTSHMRNEAAQSLDSVRETIRIGEEGGLPTQVTHHKIIGRPNWGKSVDTLKLVEDARARGVDVTIDQYPYTASSTGIAALFPQWSLEGGAKSTAERLAAPDQRARIKATVVQNLEFDRGAGDAKNVQIVNCSFDRSLSGKNLADITRARGVEPQLRQRRRDRDRAAAQRRLLGHLSRHRRRRRGAHHAVAVHHDRVRRRHSGLRPVRAAPAQLRDVRARARRVCPREARADARRRRAADVRLPRAAAEDLGPRDAAPPA